MTPKCFGAGGKHTRRGVVRSMKDLDLQTPLLRRAEEPLAIGTETPAAPPSRLLDASLPTRSGYKPS